MRSAVDLARLPLSGREAAVLVACAAGAAWLVTTAEPAMSLAICAGTLVLGIWALQPEAAVLVLAALSPFALRFDVGPLKDVRAQDGVVAALIILCIAAVIPGGRRADLLRDPAIRALIILWVIVGIWGTVTYLAGPANRWLVKDPIRNVWYAYRQVWRDLAPFPLVLLLLSGRRSADRVVNVLIGVGVAVSLYAIIDAMRTGEEAIGPFGTKNEFAGFLVLLLPFASARLFCAGSWRTRLLSGGALLIMARALMLSSSRGGYVAFLASFLPIAFLVPRRRIATAGAVALIALAFVLVVKTDLLEKPRVRRLLTLTAPSEVANLQWRQEQWGFFFDRIGERPVLGTGSDIDQSLLEMDRLGTAHNVFLALALKSGWPMAGLWVILFGVLGVLAARRSLETGPGDEARGLWLGILGCLTAAAVHGMVEASLLLPQSQHLFWILAAAAAAAAAAPSMSASPGPTAGGLARG